MKVLLIFLIMLAAAGWWVKRSTIVEPFCYEPRLRSYGHPYYTRMKTDPKCRRTTPGGCTPFPQSCDNCHYNNYNYKYDSHSHNVIYLI